MNQYEVRSGQNIYDIALMLYGSVEGVFDLLASNEWLNMETVLSYGMVLNYHEDFIVNPSVVSWFKDKNVLVKNGEHCYERIDIEKLMSDHIRTQHPEIYGNIQSLSPDEQNTMWSDMFRPRMVIRQQGRLSTIKLQLKENTHFIIDWGDCSEVEIIEALQEVELEHCYKGSGEHVITVYGDFECHVLDLSHVNGVYYPIDTIYADSFLSSLKNNDLNKLILTK